MVFTLFLIDKHKKTSVKALVFYISYQELNDVSMDCKLNVASKKYSILI